MWCYRCLSYGEDEDVCELRRQRHSFSDTLCIKLNIHAPVWYFVSFTSLLKQLADFLGHLLKQNLKTFLKWKWYIQWTFIELTLCLNADHLYCLMHNDYCYLLLNWMWYFLPYFAYRILILNVLHYYVYVSYSAFLSNRVRFTAI